MPRPRRWKHWRSSTSRWLRSPSAKRLSMFTGRRRAGGAGHHSPVLHLVQLIRDEAHRFAVTFHRKRRQMRDRATELREIPGVGERHAAIAATFWQRAGGQAGRRGRAGSSIDQATGRSGAKAFSESPVGVGFPTLPHLAFHPIPPHSHPNHPTSPQACQLALRHPILIEGGEEVSAEGRGLGFRL